MKKCQKIKKKGRSGLLMKNKIQAFTKKEYFCKNCNRLHFFVKFLQDFGNQDQWRCLICHSPQNELIAELPDCQDCKYVECCKNLSIVHQYFKTQPKGKEKDRRKLDMFY